MKQHKGKSSDHLKRGVDIFLASILLVATAPIQLAVAGIVRKKLGSPILFRQNRPGLNGDVFELVKFRSMLNGDTEKKLLRDEDRLTNFGRFLRSTSLDELPTLWNVLKGDMSIVGPRPLLVSYLARYSVEQSRRHEVRPGITGLAQVRGRNSLSWEEKFTFDIQYVDQRSTLFDFQIMLETIQSVVSRRGIAAPGSATMPEFRGAGDLSESKRHAE